MDTVRSEKEVITLKGELEIHYNTFRQQCEAEDMYYNQQFKVPVAAGYEAAVQFPETPRIAIDNAATQVDTTNIRIDVPPRNPSAKAQTQSETLRKGLLGFWHSIYHNQGLVLHDAAKHQFLYGVTFLKLVYDREIWGHRPLIKKKEKYNDFTKRLSTWRDQNAPYFPLLLMVVNPQNMLPDPSFSGPSYYIEKYKRFARDIQARWPDWRSSAKANDLVDWVEYWDKDVCIYICDGKIIQEAQEHNYGRVPCVFATAGFGLESANAKPEERWRGLLHPLHYRIRQEAQLETQIAAILEASAYPSPYFYGPEEARPALEQARDEWQAHPATMNILAVEGAELRQVEPFRIPPEAWNLLGMSTQRLQAATVEPVLTGSREQGVRAGYEVAMRAGLAKQKYGPALFSLERACEQIGERFLRMVENVIQDKITVWARTPAEVVDQAISPRDINKYYQNRVRLASVSPEEEDRLSNLGRVLYQAGAISWRTLATKYLNLENPMEELKQIMREQVYKSPEIQSMLVQGLLQTEELQQQLELMTEGEVAQWPTVGNRGMPPQAFPRPQEQTRTARPVMPGTPEEAALRVQQITQPGGYQGGRPWPPQLRR